MRRLLSFACESAALGASLDDAQGEIGLLMVTGGSQTRIGSHRMYERLAYALAREGISCLRFDRRGVGDSEGDDPGFRDSGPDMVAAADAFRREAPTVKRIFGFGLCDGGTALALHADAAGLDGIILVNPWLVEAESREPAPAAIRQHYRRRLADPREWGRLLTGGVDYRRLLKGAMKSLSRPLSPISAQVAAALGRHGLPAEVILASGDATAIAAGNELKSSHFSGLNGELQTIETSSHTFARPGDEARLLAAMLASLRRLDF